MIKQNLDRRVIGKAAEKIPLKYFANAMVYFGLGASAMHYIMKIASNQYDDPSATEIIDCRKILNCTDGVSGVPDGAYGETPANVDDIQSGSFTEEIRLNGDEPVEKIGKQGGLELELRVDPENGTVDVTEITEVPPMPSSYTEEPLHLDESLFLNSTNGNTYEIKVTDFAKEQAILEITNLETGKSVSEFVRDGYKEVLNFGNETLEFCVNDLFNGKGENKKFLKVSCETYLNE